MLIGPFSQIVTMDNLSPKGHLKDDDLVIIPSGGIRVDKGVIQEVGDFEEMEKRGKDKVFETEIPSVALPGLIDAYTLLAYAGTRSSEYVLRLSGLSYEEIAEEGGGILETVKQTRAVSQQEMTYLVIERVQHLMNNGITAAEIKSGYGLTLPDELKQLRAIKAANDQHAITLIASCFAAHAKPWEFVTPREYLEYTLKSILPVVTAEKLSDRVGVMIDPVGFEKEDAIYYLREAKKAGFAVTVDLKACSKELLEMSSQINALSVSHLDYISPEEASYLALLGLPAIVLPNISLGLGRPFPPAKRLLDAGASVTIASGWNPGTAPLGDLLTGASLLGMAEKLTIAETFAAITTRAADALALKDRGVIKVGARADFTCFPCEEYQEILYYQGAMRPNTVFIGGSCILSR